MDNKNKGLKEWLPFENDDAYFGIVRNNNLSRFNNPHKETKKEAFKFWLINIIRKL